DLDKTITKAPIDGAILKVNVRLGEYAAAGVLSAPLMTMGSIEPLHMRVDVDEADAWRVRSDSPAIARLRGNPAIAVALSFVRFEPYVLPKRSLTGDTTERVDTRVLQAIYAFRPNDFPAFVGQQVDVFIKASTRAVATQSPTSGLTDLAKRQTATKRSSTGCSRAVIFSSRSRGPPRDRTGVPVEHGAELQGDGTPVFLQPERRRLAGQGPFCSPRTCTRSRGSDEPQGGNGVTPDNGSTPRHDLHVRGLDRRGGIAITGGDTIENGSIGTALRYAISVGFKTALFLNPALGVSLSAWARKNSSSNVL